MGTPKNSEKTRAKLIEAAGRLFAEKGFKGVTVRDIAQKADTHLSALNYHFRTKEALYREVLLEACKTDAISPADQRQLLHLDPRDALFLLVKEYLGEYRKQTASNWRIVVITRECWDPGPVFAEVVQEYFKPVADLVARIIGNIFARPDDDPHVRFAVPAMIGLVETFGLYPHLVDAVAPGLMDRFDKKDELARKIVHLVLEAARPAGEA